MQHTVNTVCVIEMIDNEIITLRSFKDTPEGREEADKHFTDCAEENGYNKEAITDGLEEGVLNRGDNYYLFIAHGG